MGTALIIVSCALYAIVGIIVVCHWLDMGLNTVFSNTENLSDEEHAKFIALYIIQVIIWGLILIIKMFMGAISGAVKKYNI